MERWLVLLLYELAQIWDSSEVVPRNIPFRYLQISSFTNSTLSRSNGMLWLGELQTHAWKNDSDAILFLKPWSRGSFGHQQWEELRHILGVYRSSFTRNVQKLAIMHKGYPFELQVAAGCKAYPGNASENFVHIALQGTHAVSFQGNFWEPASDGPLWLNGAIEDTNKDRGTREMVQSLLYDTCPQLLSGLIEAGKSELEQQVKPEAWLSQGPNPGPGYLQLVCHVSGFYPKPVWVMWMRGEQELPESQRGDDLPNHDDTWYLSVTLDVAEQEAAGLCCRVKHSSLGEQDIVLHWDGSHSSSSLWVGLVSLVILLGVSMGLIIWIRRRCPCQGIL